MKPILYLVIPCYNEENTIGKFCEEFFKSTEGLREKGIFTEILFVDDGSTDNTLQVIKQYAFTIPYIKYISFSRNFGKESAMYAGLKNVDADYVAVMDVDLQDPPALLESMFNGIVNEGYDVVATRRQTREGEPKVRSFFARTYYKLTNYISDTDVIDGARDFRLMKRQVVNAILELSEKNRFSKGIFNWVGFKTKWISYNNVERSAGTTKWSFWKLFKYGINGIVAHSSALLLLPFALSALFFLSWVISLFCKLIFSLMGFGLGVAAEVWIPLLLVFGLLFLCLGIIGLYLSKIAADVKNRPIYIARETNLKEETGFEPTRKPE